jgi:hypothetical protein
LFIDAAHLGTEHVETVTGLKKQGLVTEPDESRML